MAIRLRKADTGEAGNKGQFAALDRRETEVSIDPRVTDEGLDARIELSPSSRAFASALHADRDDQGFLRVTVGLDLDAMGYGPRHVARHDPAQITEHEASRGEIETQIEMVFDDAEEFADRSGWPGEVSWDPITSTMTLRTDERSASEASDEELLASGVNETIEHLDVDLQERLNGI